MLLWCLKIRTAVCIPPFAVVVSSDRRLGGLLSGFRFLIILQLRLYFVDAPRLLRLRPDTFVTVREA